MKFVVFRKIFTSDPRNKKLHYSVTNVYSFSLLDYLKKRIFFFKLIYLGEFFMTDIMTIRRLFSILCKEHFVRNRRYLSATFSAQITLSPDNRNQIVAIIYYTSNDEKTHSVCIRVNALTFAEEQMRTKNVVIRLVVR